jgi:hypothetical protein
VDISPEFSRLKSEFNKHFHYQDDSVIDLVLGSVAGNCFDNDPLWMYLIGPPSAGKTELLMSVQGCGETVFISDITPAALISGYKDPPEDRKKASSDPDKGLPEPDPEQQDATEEESDPPGPRENPDYSLLPQLDGKVLVIKDFTLIHEKPSETRAQLLSILRDAYDGYASRAVGNSRLKGFHSRFNLLAGMTPDIERSWSLNTLGERFLMYRIEVRDRRSHARAALDSVLRKKGCSPGEVRKELQAKVKEFIDQLERFDPEVDDETSSRIIDLAELLATCRTYVHRDKQNEMACPPRAELASRVAKQLLRVVMSVALVRGRRKVTADEISMAKRIVLDSLPTVRRLLLKALYDCNSDPNGNPIEHFSSLIQQVSTTTLRRELDNLAALGAVKKGKSPVTTQSKKEKADGMLKEVRTTKVYYQLANQYREYCEKAGGI